MWIHLRIARDYNRGLPAPVRWAHVAVAVVATPVRHILRWASDPARRHWALPLLAGLVGVAALWPVDGLISRIAAHGNLTGDLRRELEALQQFGQGSSIVIGAAVIWLMDPARRRRLADWAAALLITGVLVTVVRMVIGRPRPKYGDPHMLLGPFGQYPVDGAGVRYAWEFWAPGVSYDLWSMPSSHAAYAAVMAVFVALVYPRLRGLAIALAIIVAVCRVWFQAHYPTDVLVGALAGGTVAYWVVSRRVGSRWLERSRAAPAREPDPEPDRPLGPLAAGRLARPAGPRPATRPAAAAP